MAGRRWLGRLLIAVTVLIAGAHICALPGHAHAEVDHDAVDAEHRHAPPDDGSHPDSCEGLRTAPTKLLVMLTVTPVAVTPGVDAYLRRVAEVPSFVAESPLI